MRPWSALVGLLATLVSAPFAARAAWLPTPMPNAGPALLLRLEGIREPTAAAARAVGFTVASFGFSGDAERLFLGVNDARTVGGDQPRNGKDVLADLAPYDPNLIVAGARELVRDLRAAPSGASVLVEGLVLGGSRTFLLRRVEVAAAPRAH